MDNAGGHGTGNKINQYNQILEEKNIEIIWQVPRYPETNFLDLGLWMTIKSSVQKFTMEGGANILIWIKVLVILGTIVYRCKVQTFT